MEIKAQNKIANVEPNVFIVDDDLSALAIYTGFLGSHGFKVIGSAENGKEAVNKFTSFLKNPSEIPDVILMDHRMPIKNGIEATKEIIQIEAGAKIIIISADPQIREEAIIVGATSFLEKPFKIQDIITTINNVLRTKINYYDEILDIYDKYSSGNQENQLLIHKLIIEITEKLFKDVSKQEYLNLLILIQNLFMTDIPDYCYSKGKPITILNYNEYESYMTLMKEEFIPSSCSF